MEKKYYYILYNYYQITFLRTKKCRTPLRLRTPQASGTLLHILSVAVRYGGCARFFAHEKSSKNESSEIIIPKII